MISLLEPGTYDAFAAHFARHSAESGRDGDIHFMPFAPGGEAGPAGVPREPLALGLDQVGWMRCWVAKTTAEDGQQEVVGHVDLKSGPLPATAHRCELGIGLERRARHQGLGRQLMLAALQFAQDAERLEWVDLRVFSHNTNARLLYRSLGFEEVGVIDDFVRLEGEHIADVLMTLKV